MIYKFTKHLTIMQQSSYYVSNLNNVSKLCVMSEYRAISLLCWSGNILCWPSFSFILMSPLCYAHYSNLHWEIELLSSTRLLSCGTSTHSGFRSQAPSLQPRFCLNMSYNCPRPPLLSLLSPLQGGRLHTWVCSLWELLGFSLTM